MAFIIIHLVMCVFFSMFILSGVLKVHENIYWVVIFVPVVGFCILLIQRGVELLRMSASKKLELDKMKVDNVRFMHIEMTEDDEEDITVPLEEAMLINDAGTRRKLLMDVLQRNPSEHVELLMAASNSSDTELTHYATTTMMEVQSEYEAKIKKLTDELEFTDNRERVLGRLRYAITEFVKSGLLTGNILKLYQNRLESILDELIDLHPGQKVYVMELANVCLDLNKLDKAKDLIKELVDKWPDDEDVYRLRVDYFYACGRGDKIQDVLKEIKEKKLYLSAEGRHWMEFWQVERD